MADSDDYDPLITQLARDLVADDDGDDDYLYAVLDLDQPFPDIGSANADMLLPRTPPPMGPFATPTTRRTPPFATPTLSRTPSPVPPPPSRPFATPTLSRTLATALSPAVTGPATRIATGEGASGNAPASTQDSRKRTRLPSNVCGECGAAFAQKYTLTRHMLSHTGDRPYVCGHGTCRAAFAQMSDLTRHMRTHTGDRPYVCGECGAAFADRSAFGRHKLIHTGERPYSCGECGAAFRQKCHLTAHMRTHTGERPYVCGYGTCGAAFTQTSDLTRHMRTHTGGSLADSSSPIQPKRVQSVKLGGS
jgi:uncharacterized Zn-finger protein